MLVEPEKWPLRNNKKSLFNTHKKDLYAALHLKENENKICTLTSVRKKEEKIMATPKRSRFGIQLPRHILKFATTENHNKYEISVVDPNWLWIGFQES